MADYILRCTACGHGTPEDAYHVACPACGGFLEVELAEVPAELLDRSQPSIFKYHRLMPYGAAPELLAQETIEATPLVRPERLSDTLGVEIILKDETAMPTGTWKDREGFVSIHRLAQTGIQDLVVFSSGNTGTSLARSASLVRGPRLHIVVPNASQDRIRSLARFFDPEFVKVHYFDGSNDECIVRARQLAEEQGLAIEGGFTNYARREGLKLLGLELALEWGERYDWYAQSVAGGIGLYSMHKAYRDMGREGDCPRILGVQADICAPMVNAWRAGAATLEPRFVPKEVVPSPYVRVLRTRNPHDSYPVIKPIMDKVGGAFEDVSGEQIHEALRFFYLDPYYRAAWRERGLVVGLEAATALAGVVKSVRLGTIAKGSKVVVNVSGAAKTGDVNMDWIADLLK